MRPARARSSRELLFSPRMRAIGEELLGDHPDAGCGLKARFVSAHVALEIPDAAWRQVQLPRSRRRRPPSRSPPRTDHRRHRWFAVKLRISSGSAGNRGSSFMRRPIRRGSLAVDRLATVDADPLACSSTPRPSRPAAGLTLEMWSRPSVPWSSSTKAHRIPFTEPWRRCSDANFISLVIDWMRATRPRLGCQSGVDPDRAVVFDVDLGLELHRDRGWFRHPCRSRRRSSLEVDR